MITRDGFKMIPYTKEEKSEAANLANGDGKQSREITIGVISAALMFHKIPFREYNRRKVLRRKLRVLDSRVKWTDGKTLASNFFLAFQTGRESYLS